MADTDENPEPAWPSADQDTDGEAVVESTGEGTTGQPHGSAETTYLAPVDAVARAERHPGWPAPTRPGAPPRPPAAPPRPPSRPQPPPPNPPYGQPSPPPPANPQPPPPPANPQPPRPTPPPPANREQPTQFMRSLPVPPAAPARPMRIDPAGEPRPAREADGEEQVTAPARVPEAATGPDGDPEQGPPSGTEPETRTPSRRSRRPFVLGGAAVLVVLVAAGVVLALPDVSNRLGLPWAPNLPTAEAPQPVAVSRDLQRPDASAPSPSAAGVADALRGPAADAALGTLTGTVVDPASGTELWDKDAGKALTPASTTKLLTGAAALLALDHGTQLSTKLVEGAEPGTAVLVAGGDITLSSRPPGEESIYPGAAHLDDLVAQAKKATGGDLREVRLDLSAFTGDTSAAGWAPEDVPSTYAAAVVPAMLDGGRSSATDPGAMRVANPAGELVGELASRLGASVGEPSTTTAPEGARVLAEVRSAPMAELVDEMLRSSDNTLADALARQVAIAEGERPSFEGGAKATLKVLSRNGFDVDEVELADGSGLSTENRVSARMLAELLAVAAAPDGSDPRTASLRPLVGGLPVAGGTGTLADRYTNGSSSEGKGWVRAKTGTLSGVNTLAGLVLDADGRVLVFALMSAGGATEPARAALDDVAAQLRTCGCR